MFQGPKGYIAQICEVHLQYGNSTTKWPFYTFFSKFHSNIYSILFDYNLFNVHGTHLILINPISTNVGISIYAELQYKTSRHLVALT